MPFPAAVHAAESYIAHATAIATIAGITGGNFRLVDRLLTQIQRVQTVNDLPVPPHESSIPRGRLCSSAIKR